MLLRHFSVTGLIVGTLFFAFSLTPSLLPRPWLAQGIISGLSFAAGYGHEIAAEHYIDAWVALTEPEDWSAPELERLKAHFRRDPAP